MSNDTIPMVDAVTQRKMHTIDFSKGFGYGLREPEIPPGFFCGKNMAYYSADGSFGTRRTYTVAQTFPEGVICSGTYNYEYGLIHARSDGLGYGGVMFTWTDTDPAPTFNTNTGVKFAALDKYILCNSLSYYVIMDLSDYTAKYLRPDGATKILSVFAGICTHQDRIFCISPYAKYQILYSENVSLGGPIAGYSNYMNVGHGTRVVGLYEIGGQLWILKEDEIWIKQGYFDRPVAYEFTPLVTGCEISWFGHCVADGFLYYCNRNGIYRINSSGQTQDITDFGAFKPFWRSFTYQNHAKMFYNTAMNWIYVSLPELINSETYDGFVYKHTFVFDCNLNRWYYFPDMGMISGFSSQGRFYTTHTGENKVREWNELKGVGFSSAETTLTSTLKTGWLDLGNPYSEKYLRSIHVSGWNCTNVKIYYRDTVADSPTTAHADLTLTADFISIDIERPFREVCLEFYDSENRNMQIKSAMISYDERSI